MNTVWLYNDFETGAQEIFRNLDVVRNSLAVTCSMDPSTKLDLVVRDPDVYLVVNPLGRVLGEVKQFTVHDTAIHL